MSDDGQKPIEQKSESQKTGDASEKQSLPSRTEAGAELQSGQLNVRYNAEKDKQFSTGKSGVSGLFENDENGGLPKAKDLFGDLAHSPLTGEKLDQIDQMKKASDQGQLLGAGGQFVQPSSSTQEGIMIAQTAKPKEISQLELERMKQLDAHAEKIRDNTGTDAKWHFQNNPNDLAGKVKETLWNQFHSTPHESLNEIQAAKEHKLLPKDGGEPIGLKQLLTDYKTPFIDAYEKSKHLQDGEPGKSKTLELVIDRLKDCPWADLINIKFDSTVENPDYDPVKSTITIRPQDSPAEQIEKFVHESTHSTHQALQKLYMGNGALSKELYAETLGQLEALTFKNEIAVHYELTAAMGAPPVSYSWRNADGKPQPPMDLGNLYVQTGFDGLKKFILDDAHTDMQDLQHHWHSWNYRTYYQETHTAYAGNWQNARNQLEDRFKQDSSYKAKVLKDGY